MNSLLLENVLHQGRRCNILIEGKRYARIVDAEVKLSAEKVVDAEGLAIIPALYNTHNHAAMIPMRGYAEDMALGKWLNEYIWPYEAKMTADDIGDASKLAVEEMISSGSVFFNDMYFCIEKTIDAVIKSGMRAAIGITVMDNHSLAQTEEKKRYIEEWKDPTGGRIQLVMAPHAIYTVCEDKLKKTAEYARNKGMKLHIHVSETRSEVDDCIKAHGMTPVQYLDSIGFLGPDVIAGHCVHVDQKDADILAERQVVISHCPCSNMKLGSGRMPSEMLIKAGCKITLGTDGASSNNNLDLREEMKIAGLLAKSQGDPENLPAEELFKWATVNGAEAFGIDGGIIAEGRLADGILLDMNNVRMKPCHNIIYNWIYSADSSVISKVLCDGKIIFNR